MPLSWSRDAVIYQIYVRSFADADGDGVGDLLGVASRLDYVAALGVDAIWLTPFYPSPMADGGYDVADYRGVDHRFGTLADFDKLLAQAHSRGLKVIIDVVPNHTSSAHPWFAAAVAAGPGSPERSRFHFRPGRGPRGLEPPNNWRSVFHGPAWTRLPDGDWYLHLFSPEQPDVNWDHPQVRAEFADVLRFWLDRGVDGMRIDVAHGLVKSSGLPDVAPPGMSRGDNPAFDQDGVHQIYREWRSILDGYRPERIAVAEAWVSGPDRAARYVRPGELHQAFNFDLLEAPWSAPAYRNVIDSSLTAMNRVGAPTTWVLSNHDVVRHASRFTAGIVGTAGGASAADARAIAAGASLGLRRARAAALLMLALPGSAYIYQGEELGLPEVVDLPDAARQDPIFARSGGAELGRDGCRVPLPWSGTQPPYGFGPDGSVPWLPQPPAWAELSVAAQADDPGSMLTLYRTALRLRRKVLGRGGAGASRPDAPATGAMALRWHSAAADRHLAFTSAGPGGTGGITCVVNLGPGPIELPDLARVAAPLVASAPLPEPGRLPPDTAAWWPAP